MRGAFKIFRMLAALQAAPRIVGMPRAKRSRATRVEAFSVQDAGCHLPDDGGLFRDDPRFSRIAVALLPWPGAGFCQLEMLF